MSGNAKQDCEKCGMTFPRPISGRRQNHPICPLCDPPTKSLGQQGFRSLKILLIVALLFAGLAFQTCSYKRIAEVRQIARIPQTSIAAAIPGEVNLAGRAQQAEKWQVLKAPDSGAECFYYHYLKEREEKDSDGDTSWVTVREETRLVPFELRDGSGTIRISPIREANFNIEQSHRRRSGNYRYTEHRIDSGDRLFVFGFLKKGNEEAPRRVVFDAKGDYSPIISEKSERGERNSKSVGSIWLCWAGLGILAGASAVTFWVLNLHRILLFFGILTIVISSVLFYQGLRMMKSDLTTAHERIGRQEKVVRELFEQELATSQPPWDGVWSNLGDISDFKEVPAAKRTRLRRVRIDFTSATRRVQAQRESFPYRWLAPFLSLPDVPEVPLTARDEELLQKLEKNFVPAKISRTAGFIGVAIALLAGLGSFFFGFRTILRKRLLENLPTTPAAGVSFGLTELGGVVDLPEGTSALTAPLSANPCTYFHYKIQEKRGSGKNAKWVTIHDEVQQQRFLCRDQSGSMPIDPEGARLDCWQTESRKEGRKQHTERTLRVGDPLHALGYAKLDEETGDSLVLAAPEGKGFTGASFVLSSYSEESMVRRGGVAASLILCLTFSAVLFAGLMLFATLGSFNPASYLAAALIGPALMILFAILLHYNDLVFLRERAKRAWSNIEVALQKRSDLIPALNEIARTALSHEKELQEDITRLRVKGRKPENADGFGKELTNTQETSRKLIALAEAYPDLKAGKTLNQLSRQLAICENEIAFASTSYNDSVETYNTRISTLPDMLLAKLGRFRAFDFLDAKLETIEIRGGLF